MGGRFRNLNGLVSNNVPHGGKIYIISVIQHERVEVSCDRLFMDIQVTQNFISPL